MSMKCDSFDVVKSIAFPMKIEMWMNCIGKCEFEFFFFRRFRIPLCRVNIKLCQSQSHAILCHFHMNPWIIRHYRVIDIDLFRMGLPKNRTNAHTYYLVNLQYLFHAIFCINDNIIYGFKIVHSCNSYMMNGHKKKGLHDETSSFRFRK